MYFNLALLVYSCLCKRNIGMILFTINNLAIIIVTSVHFKLSSEYFGYNSLTTLSTSVQEPLTGSLQYTDP